MAKANPDSEKKTESVYVGKERYARLEEVARRVAYITNCSVKTNWIVHNIIDHHLGKIEEDMIARLKMFPASQNETGDKHE